MKTKEKIKEAKQVLDLTENLYTAYVRLRGTGHTTLLKEGTNNYKETKMIIVSNNTVKNNLFREEKNIVCLDHFKTHGGYPILLNLATATAIAIDNSAMIELLDMQRKIIYNLLEIIEDEN